MTPSVFTGFLAVAVVSFLACLPVIQWLFLGEMRRRGRNPDVLHACSVRDHVLRAVLRTARPGLLLAAVAFAVWIAIRRPAPGWAWALGAEVLLALVVLQLGLSVLTLRFVLQAASSPRTSGRVLVAVRISVLVAGWLYGLAVWFLAPGGPGETLFAVVILGVGLGLLGLNRLAGAGAESLSRYAGR